MNNNSFSKLFLERYPNRQGIVNYVSQAIGKADVKLSDLTKPNLKKINEVILANVSNGSAKTYFAQIKAFINLYKDEAKLPCTDTQKVLHAKNQPSQNVYLSESEISQLETYLLYIENHPSTKQVQRQTEIDILHAFLAECYCGARGCDVASFTDDNFRDGYLTYISKKTQVLSRLPIHKCLLAHLHHTPKKQYKTFVQNRVIKRICKLLGFNEPKTLFYHGSLQTRPKYEYVGFHTARRSFATNLHLRNVPLAIIAQMMNHGTDLQMTQRYIVVDSNSFGDNALAFFQ